MTPEEKEKIYQRHYSQFTNVAEAKRWVLENGPMPSSSLWVWIRDLEGQMPMKKAFEEALRNQREALT